MATCRICNKTYRKGRIAFVMADRGLKSARVCQSCASDGAIIVAARPPVIQKAERHRAPEEVLKTLRAQLKGLKATQLQDPRDPNDEDVSEEQAFIAGRIEGLENAIGAFKSRVG